jgi:dihydroorotase
MSIWKVKKIDTHVHFRDDEESHKETIRGGSEKAAAQGIMAVCDMPNTKKPILWEEDVVKRLKLAEEEKSLVKYFLWIGITTENDQIEEAVRMVRTFPQVVGIKLYAGESTGNLGVIEEKDQEKIYRDLSKLGYKGVLAVHCEKEKELKRDLWDPKKPWTHGEVRPIRAETRAVRDQVKLSYLTDFKGYLHICHASCRETVEIVRQTRIHGLRVSFEITPHHFLLDERQLRRPEGLVYKVNPPLRKPETVEMLKEIILYLAKKETDTFWIATDFAPHTLEEKFKFPYPSGISDYALYGRLLDSLSVEGLSRAEIERLTFGNIVRTFGKKFETMS